MSSIPQLSSLIVQWRDSDRDAILKLLSIASKRLAEDERPIGEEELARIWNHLDTVG
jgi:hypothetical protein